ncbi:hypothetical protein DCO58_00760 [Helicobacter saguini]|uniref:Lipoprotein n=1 Tax=Helicobacter saguini TaxID=1548018 RepID=A0A347VR13_9HELI|nr:hypothetical protein [Helicobacter saguini]MWV63079.1 hypothetical protein [Helicobacter saguini]MWV66251.1 hypothetical protein [Helicobacter saguini]MWV68604.1 hypothetical protein [Helicobacter saguini]MWV71845.1 hypothetical protein [Helicobacter saguini]TLD95864.1 hypothetical protein LS64_000410 [Helicobacter saguini]
MRYFLAFLICVIFSGCSYKIQTQTPENNEYGFTTQDFIESSSQTTNKDSIESNTKNEAIESSVKNTQNKDSIESNTQNTHFSFENPPKGKARIYIYSKLNINILNGLTGYFLSLHYGDFDKNKPYKTPQNIVYLGFAKKPMAKIIDLTRVDEKAVIYARNLGFRETLEFIPKADNIYCIEVNAKFVPFLGIGRPYFALIDKQTCKQNAPQFFEKYSKNHDETYEKKYSDKFWKKVKGE